MRALYSLAEAGIQTVPVLVALGNWGLDVGGGGGEVGWRSRELRNRGPEFVTQFMDELRDIHLGSGESLEPGQNSTVQYFAGS